MSTRSVALIRQREEASRYREAKANVVWHRHLTGTHNQALASEIVDGKALRREKREALQLGAHGGS